MFFLLTSTHSFNHYLFYFTVHIPSAVFLIVILLPSRMLIISIVHCMWNADVGIQEKPTGRSAHYKLTSTAMLWLQTSKTDSGTMNLGGSLTRQVTLLDGTAMNVLDKYTVSQKGSQCHILVKFFHWHTAWEICNKAVI